MASFLAGCFPTEGVDLVSEREERSYLRGKQLLREGRRQEALSAFLSVIEKRRGDAPESHLEVGELYRTHIKDPVSAIYHYRKYLEISGGSEQAPHVRQLIETATKDFAASLPAQPMQVRYERLELLETVENLKRENLELKRRLAASQEEQTRIRQAAQVRSERPAPTANPASRTTTASAPVSAPASSAPANTGTRTYTVESGDTLIRISGRVYGTGTRWKDIFEANRDVLPNENSLKIGMVLRIPQ